MEGIKENMSFSTEVKEELSKIANLANKEEVKCEFLGYFESNNISIEERNIKFSTENDYNLDRFLKIIRNLNIENFEIKVLGKVFVVEIPKKDILEIKEFDDKDLIKNLIKSSDLKDEILSNNNDENVIKHLNNSIEKIKPFIRGIFLGSGSINNPEKKYHLECSLREKNVAIQIAELMKKNQINLKQMQNTLYIKDGEEISKFLAFIGASKSVLKFEEIRVKRHMNNKINRIVNCKTANLNKVLNASIEQIDAIKKLKDEGKFEKMDKSLKEVAELRLEYPDMSLVELGKLLSTPLGKSGVNYRLKKLIELSKK